MGPSLTQLSTIKSNYKSHTHNIYYSHIKYIYNYTTRLHFIYKIILYVLCVFIYLLLLQIRHLKNVSKMYIVGTSTIIYSIQLLLLYI